MNISEQHRDRSDLSSSDWEYHLRRLLPVVSVLKETDRRLGEWYVKGMTEQEALQRRVYEDMAPSTAAIDFFSKKYRGKGKDKPKTIGIWNGINSDEEGASIRIGIDGKGLFAKSIEIEINEKDESSYSRLGNYISAAGVIEKIVNAYGSLYVTLGPHSYNAEKTFDDRPGVSWMLYLPHVLTLAQVPEARDLIPVMRDGEQQGTIIVSVTDEVFDVNNREHLKVANDIEIRLADQDLLPRFVDL
ncbi:immunity 52 family protein [Paraburkholderia sp. MMS20-SJTN17]|uniref:Immunity 52 family protein n=1 Tax=Paraburkholderia translucens TaxID=2886945 RepID=A0ABS8KDU0_9BURK|nr:immunity 52 family protein [Paraburkholderia sp. MMS20-SJTN17]MCC8402935.1 immunity 52 family protein [Paraburkholderia sp. MMS20-SJTN17]